MNSLNSLKNISIKKFVEHVVEEIKVNVPEGKKGEQIPVSREEREQVLLTKFKNAISISLEGLNIKNLIDIKDQSDNISTLEDDAVSVSSSRYFANMNKNSHKGLKLPFIIGTNEFFKSEYLGIHAESERKFTDVTGNSNRTSHVHERSISYSELDKNLNSSANKLDNFANLSNLSNIPHNSQMNSNYNMSPNIPSVPLVNSSVPAVPNVPIAPPLMKSPPNFVNNTATNNLINLQPNSNQEQINNDFNNDQANLAHSSGNFKDDLNKRFGHSNTINVNPSTANQILLNTEASNQSKQIKLDQFVKKGNYNMFDIPDEEDEEDISTLFKKNTTVAMKKSTLFNEGSQNRESSVKPNLFNEDSIISGKDTKEKPKNMDLESKYLD
jgi:hypothetical protein